MLLDTQKENIKLEGHTGTFYVVGYSVCPRTLQFIYLMESEQWGEDAPHVIVNDNLDILLEHVQNGFEDYLYYLATSTN